MFRIIEHGGSFIVPLITFTSIYMYCCIFFLNRVLVYYHP